MKSNQSSNAYNKEREKNMLNSPEKNKIIKEDENINESHLASSANEKSSSNSAPKTKINKKEKNWGNINNNDVEEHGKENEKNISKLQNEIKELKEENERLKNEIEELKEKNRVYLNAYKLMETRLDGIEEHNARLLKISDKLNIFLKIYPEFQAIFEEKKEKSKRDKKGKSKANPDSKLEKEKEKRTVKSKSCDKSFKK